MDTGEVFYVGKGTGDRCKAVAGRNNYFKNYHNKYDCKVRKVKENLLEQDAFKLEIELISKYRKINQCQCNLTDGGEGAVFTEGSWDDMYRKLRMAYYNPHSVIGNLANADEYYYENLKTKSLEEMTALYKSYEEHSLFKNINQGLYEDFIKCNPSYIDYRNIDSFEIMIMCEEIKMLTELFTISNAKNNPEFEGLLECKSEIDYMCLNLDTDKFIYNLLLDNKYKIELIHVLTASMWFLKKIGDSLHVQIKTFSLKEDRFLYIRFNSKQHKQLMSVKIDLYDLIWGVLVFKDKPLYQIIYEEIIVSPFI